MSAVERRFPAAAEFLAAVRGGGPAPVFGPGELQNVHDDQPEPWVTVRVDYRMSRWELFAAVSAGYATTNVDRSPDDMTVEQIRYDVEGFLALTSSLELDALVEEIAGKVERGEDPEQMAALLRAMDRAYPQVSEIQTPAPEFAAEFPHVAAHLARERGETPAVQRPVYEGGTVTLDTLDAGRITIDEPVWCTGHDGEQVVQRVDVTHVGVTVTGEYAGVEFLPACISWGPFAQLRPEPLPLADVDEFPGMTPDELRELGVEVVRHGCALHSKANELDRIRRGMS